MINQSLPTKLLETYQPLLQSLNLSPSDWIASLTKEHLPVLLIKSEHRDQLRSQWTSQNFPFQTLSWFPRAISWPLAVPMGTILPGYQENMLYPLNPSSLLPVMALGTNLHGFFLDACASPGGKTLATYLNNPNLNIISNDASPQRKHKLVQTVQAWQLPVQVLLTKAELLYRKFPQTFDYILADVPCSSEVHVINSPHHLNIWNPNRIKSLAHAQFAILSSLIRCLKVNGTLIYSTCALNQFENELIIDQLLKRYGNYVSLSPVNLPINSAGGLPTLNLNYEPELVRRIWPHMHNQDPMFIAKIVKTNPL